MIPKRRGRPPKLLPHQRERLQMGGSSSSADVLVLMDQLIQARAQYTLGQAAPALSWSCHLWIAPRVPVCTDTWAQYAECTLPGYAAQALSTGTWSGSITACVGTWTYPALTYTFSAGGQTIYGHLVYDLGNNVLGWVDAYLNPYTVPAGGGQLLVALGWQERQYGPC